VLSDAHCLIQAQLAVLRSSTPLNQAMHAHLTIFDPQQLHNYSRFLYWCDKLQRKLPGILWQNDPGPTAQWLTSLRQQCNPPTALPPPLTRPEVPPETTPVDDRQPNDDHPTICAKRRTLPYPSSISRPPIIHPSQPSHACPPHHLRPAAAAQLLTIPLLVRQTPTQTTRYTLAE
jgi:hypothetical protein